MTNHPTLLLWLIFSQLRAGAALTALLAEHGISELTAAYPADPRRKIYFQALRTRTTKSSVVGKHDVAAAVADHAAVGENGHGVERSIDYAVGTTRLFVHHRRWPIRIRRGLLRTIETFGPGECSAANGEIEIATANVAGVQPATFRFYRIISVGGLLGPDIAFEDES